MDHKWDPIKVMTALTVLNGLAGLAALLRSDERVTPRSILTACLNSAFMGLIVALIWWHWFNADGTSVYFVAAVSLLAGLGGNTTFYFVAQMIQRKFGIPIDPTGKGESPDDDENDADTQ